MTKVKTYCVPPEMAFQMVERCADLVVMGLSSAPERSLDDVLSDIEARRVQMWVVFDGEKPVAVGMTEILSDDLWPFVSVFGLGGKQVWRWARSFAEAIVAFAKAEGCGRVLFAGKKGWGRLIPHAHSLGTVGDQEIFERVAQ